MIINNYLIILKKENKINTINKIVLKIEKLIPTRIIKNTNFHELTLTQLINEVIKLENNKILIYQIFKLYNIIKKILLFNHSFKNSVFLSINFFINKYEKIFNIFKFNYLTSLKFDLFLNNSIIKNKNNTLKPLLYLLTYEQFNIRKLLFNEKIIENDVKFSIKCYNNRTVVEIGFTAKFIKNSWNNDSKINIIDHYLKKTNNELIKINSAVIWYFSKVNTDKKTLKNNDLVFKLNLNQLDLYTNFFKTANKLEFFILYDKPSNIDAQILNLNTQLNFFETMLLEKKQNIKISKTKVLQYEKKVSQIKLYLELLSQDNNKQ